jgi:hypothetical protein
MEFERIELARTSLTSREYCSNETALNSAANIQLLSFFSSGKAQVFRISNSVGSLRKSFLTKNFMIGTQ